MKVVKCILWNLEEHWKGRSAGDDRGYQICSMLWVDIVWVVSESTVGFETSEIVSKGLASKPKSLWWTSTFAKARDDDRYWKCLEILGFFIREEIRLVVIQTTQLLRGKCEAWRRHGFVVQGSTLVPQHCNQSEDES